MTTPPKLTPDENGWQTGMLPPLPGEHAWTLFSPEPEARIDVMRWAHQASRFFSLNLVVAPEKKYPSGTVPIADACDVVITQLGTSESGSGSGRSRVRVVTVPIDRAPEARSRALAIARGPHGGGFEALILRAKRLWQIDTSVLEGDERAPLAAAAVIASVLLAPVVPPGEAAVFGVKTARERLERLGFKT